MTQVEYSGEFPTLPIKVSTDKAEELAAKAKSLAWALGTSEKKYQYSGGSPTPACKSAMNKRGYSTKVSLSDCGYFQNSIIYAVLGIKIKILGSVKEAFPSVSGFKVVHTGTIGSEVLKIGDIIRYKKTNGGQHTLMYVGDGVIAEAGRKTRFGRMIKSTKYNGSNVKHSTIQVLRVVEATKDKAYISKGDSGSEVTKLQKFLNWAGFDCGSADGVFGDKTLSAVKSFQKKVGLTADGEFGEKSLEKAKAYTIEVQPTKEPYSGTFPKLPARRYFKRGDKGTQVKYLQQFLNWYGNYGLVVDGVIGSNTIIAVEKFQKSEKLDVDGLFGKQCLARAKVVKK